MRYRVSGEVPTLINPRRAAVRGTMSFVIDRCREEEPLCCGAPRKSRISGSPATVRKRWGRFPPKSYWARCPRFRGRLDPNPGIHDRASLRSRVSFRGPEGERRTASMWPGDRLQVYSVFMIIVNGRPLPMGLNTTPRRREL